MNPRRDENASWDCEAIVVCEEAVDGGDELDVFCDIGVGAAAGRGRGTVVWLGQQRRLALYSASLAKQVKRPGYDGNGRKSPLPGVRSSKKMCRCSSVLHFLDN
jgi:hypothetical protein